MIQIKDPKSRALIIFAGLGLGCCLLISICAAVTVFVISLQWPEVFRLFRASDVHLTPLPIFTPVSVRTTSSPSPDLKATPIPTGFKEGEELQGKIVFTCFIDGYDEICLMDTLGRESQRLTFDPATDFYPSLSPGGASIVFSSRRDSRFEIYRMDINGENQVRLSEGLGSLFAPDVSPDGQAIVFTNVDEGHQSIWVMKNDGSDPHPLTEGSWDDIDPTWSPDGQQIAFASNRGGSRQLYIMHADGSELRRVTQGGVTNRWAQ